MPPPPPRSVFLNEIPPKRRQKIAGIFAGLPISFLTKAGGDAIRIISFFTKAKSLFFVILLPGVGGGRNRPRLPVDPRGSGLSPPAARPRPSRLLRRRRGPSPAPPAIHFAPLGIKFAPLGIKLSSRAREKRRRRSLPTRREKNNSSGPVRDFFPGRPGSQRALKPAHFAPIYGF